ncbi:efflux RND transporter permease subunit [Caedibacter taeniospiralis]|uniref:efflux RND transporter permease subunit n=1 Tax=Caedibacter taeniospiralis TaxID=28907 RepID=UPI0037C10803
MCLFGLYALLQNKIAPFPPIQLNQINVNVSYPGANAETVAKQITNEVTMNLQSVDNIKRITATTQAGGVHLALTLQDHSDTAMLKTQMDVMQAISSANLPGSVPQPQIHIESGNSGLITYFVASQEHKLFYLQNFVQSVMAPYFKSLPGVVAYADSQNPTLAINLNPEAIAKYRLDPVKMSDAIDRNYSSAPLGSLYIKGAEYILNSDNGYDSEKELGEMIVGFIDDLHNLLGRPIYLKDIASIHFAPKLSASSPYASFNGEISASVSLNTNSDANPFTVSRLTQAYVTKLQERYGNEFKISSIFDMAEIMKNSMTEVAFTIGIAAFLVLLVVLAFLGRLRVTLIPIITIPICLLGTAIFIYLAGMTINILTLLAMVIAVGLVVDDAIVVVEYITHCAA